MPGWHSPDGPLSGTLNSRANRVLEDAIQAGVKSGGGLDKDTVDGLLRVGFCCLAQLDDRGNVVRAFATLEKMLTASGVYERHPERQEQYKNALRAALEVFQRATLINVGRDRRFVSYLATKRAVLEELASESQLLASCRTAIAEAGTPLLERAQAAGDARTDASFDDVLRLVIGITLTGDADQLDRLLTMALDGIRTPRER